MALVLRNVKGSRLTFTELDGNFTYLEGLDLSGVAYNIGSELLTLTRNNGGTLTTTIPTGGGSFTGNTSGSCITDLWVSTIHGCSPLTIDTNVKSPTSTVSGDYTFAYGYQTSATTIGAYATGGLNLASGQYSYVSGYQNTASGSYAHAQNVGNDATGLNSHAEGANTLSSGYTSHSEGSETIAGGNYSHAQGYLSSAEGIAAHAEGQQTTASGDWSHAEGSNTSAEGYYSHAQNYGTRAIGNQSHASGNQSVSEGHNSFAHGYLASASTVGSFSMGYRTHVRGDYAAVLGGTDQDISAGATHSAILGGEDNTIVNSTHAAIIGGKHTGKGLTQDDHYSIILGGEDSEIYSAQRAGILLGKTNYIHDGEQSVILGGSLNGIYDNADNGVIIGGVSNSLNNCPNSVIVGGKGHWINESLTDTNSVIIGGTGHTIDSYSLSVVIGGKDIDAAADNTVYVPNLNIDSTPSNDNALTQILARDTDGSVKYRDASSLGGGGGGTFTGNTSGTCISELWVSNIQSCSPLNINPGDEGNVYFGSSSGVTIDVTGESITAQDLYVGEYIYHEGDTNTNIRFTPDRIRIEAGATEYICIQDDPPGPATGEIAFNEDGAQVNTRIEGGTNENLFFVNGQAGYDSIGINSTGRTDAILHVSGDTRIDGRTTTENFTMTTGAVNSYVLTSDVGGNASWAASSGGGGSFTGNTSGTCISDIFVSNIHSCSPLNINPGDEGSVYFGSSSGVTINVADERIGIGTAGSTNYKLWIKEATTHAQGKIESDNSYARWIIDSHDTHKSILQFNEANDRRWQIAADGSDDSLKILRQDITTGGTIYPAVIIDPTDNVGIGVDPSYKLDVKIDEEAAIGAATTILNLTHDVGTDLNQQKLLVDFHLEDNNVNGTPQVKIGAEVGENGVAGTQQKEGSGAFVIYTASGNSVTTNVISEKMRVDYAGNVGIGTTTPGVKLHVEESGSTLVRAVQLRLQTKSSGDMGAEGDMGSAIEFVNADGNNENTSKIESINAGGTVSGEMSSNLLFWTDNNGTLTEKMRVDYAGNVGIGTTTPDEKLHLSGAASTQIKITGGLNAGLIIDGAENSFVEYKEDASRKWIVGNHQSDDHFKWATGTTFSSDTVMELSRAGGLTVHNFQMLSGATDGYVLTSDVSGNASWGPVSGATTIFTGNTSGTCISELWVTTISGCSPVTLGPAVTVLGEFTIMDDTIYDSLGNTPITFGNANTYIHGDIILTSNSILDDSETTCIQFDGGGNTNIMADIDVQGQILSGGTDLTDIFCTTPCGGATIDPYLDFGSPGVAPITWDVSGTSTNYEIILTGDTTLQLSNVRNGEYGTLMVHQDGVGSHTLSLTAATHYIVNGGGGQPTLTATAGATDILSFTYNGTAFYWTVGNDYT